MIDDASRRIGTRGCENRVVPILVCGGNQTGAHGAVFENLHQTNLGKGGFGFAQKLQDRFLDHVVPRREFEQVFLKAQVQKTPHLGSDDGPHNKTNKKDDGDHNRVTQKFLHGDFFGKKIGEWLDEVGGDLEQPLENHHQQGDGQNHGNAANDGGFDK